MGPPARKVHQGEWRRVCLGCKSLEDSTRLGSPSREKGRDTQLGKIRPVQVLGNPACEPGQEEGLDSSPAH
jgi:hypothetical protein